MKIIKKDCRNEQEINIDNYLMKKKTKREYGRDRYQNISEEFKQRLKEYQKNHRKAKNPTQKSQHKIFFIFFLYSIKMEQKVLIFDKQCIIKNAFYNYKHLIYIDKADTIK